MSTPNINPISTASFTSNSFVYDPLYADETVSISAQLSSGQGVLQRGQVLCGWAVGTARNVPLSTTGSACAILANTTDTGTGGPVTAVVYVQGKFLAPALIASGNGLELDSAELWNVGIYVLTAQQQSGKLVPWSAFPATPGVPMPSAPPYGAEAVLNPTSATVLAAGGDGSFAVTVTGDWAVGLLPGWVTCTPMNGSGDATVTYTASPNTSGLPKQALIDVNGSKFTLNQGAV
jgi:hypothetical protein